MRVTGAARHWRIALPGLQQALAATRDRRRPLPALDWVLARALRSPSVRPWREWLLEGAALGEDVLARFPQGPCVRAAWTGEAPAGCWACAGPVHLFTALDHLRLLAPAPLPLEEDESAVLVHEINERLAGLGFRLHAVTGRGWLCECAPELECSAPDPELAAGGDLREWLPDGRDARRVQAWVNAAQMVLHDHPLNDARASRGHPPVNSVWLWGFGVAGRPAGRATSTLVSDDDWLTGLWQLHGGRVSTPDVHACDGVVEDSSVARVAIAGVRSAQADAGWLEMLEGSLFAPLREGLARGRVEAASVHIGSEMLHLDRRTRWRFWRRSPRLPQEPA